MACAQEVLAEDLKKTKEEVLSLLKEKRSMLISLQKERKIARKHEHECKELRRQVGMLEDSISAYSSSHSHASVTPETQDIALNDSVEMHRACKAKNATLLRRNSNLEREMRQSRAKVCELENHKVVLEAEVMRLAESLSKTVQSSPEEDLLKEQLHIYEKDFDKERGEKEAAEGRVSSLRDTVQDCQDLISTLTREVDLYKSAYEREKREKELVLTHGREGFSGNISYSHPEPFPLLMNGRSQVIPSAQLQVVYPVVDTKTQEQNLRRKQQLNRVGVFARDSTARNSLFYGGEVDVDSL